VVDLIPNIKFECSHKLNLNQKLTLEFENLKQKKQRKKLYAFTFQNQIVKRILDVWKIVFIFVEFYPSNLNNF